jgi:DNA-binding MarR family transcriptional regulator
MTNRPQSTRRTPRRPAASPGQSAADFMLSESPSHLLRRAEQLVADMFARSGLRGGVTLRQSVLLAAIAESEGASQSDLVRITGVDRSTLAEMIARMEQRGLIARAAARDDGRAKSVRLTAQGRRRLDSALPAMRQVDKALLAALPASGRAAFRELLATLARSAEDADTAGETAARSGGRAMSAKASPPGRLPPGKRR